MPNRRFFRQSWTGKSVLSFLCHMYQKGSWVDFRVLCCQCVVGTHVTCASARARVCVYMCVCERECVFVCVCAHVCMYVHKRMRTCARAVCECVSARVCECQCERTCVCVCVCVCACACVHAYVRARVSACVHGRCRVFCSAKVTWFVFYKFLK